MTHAPSRTKVLGQIMEVWDGVLALVRKDKSLMFCGSQDIIWQVTVVARHERG